MTERRRTVLWIAALLLLMTADTSAVTSTLFGHYMAGFAWIGDFAVSWTQSNVANSRPWPSAKTNVCSTCTCGVAPYPTGDAAVGLVTSLVTGSAVLAAPSVTQLSNATFSTTNGGRYMILGVGWGPHSNYSTTSWPNKLYNAQAGYVWLDTVLVQWGLVNLTSSAIQNVDFPQPFPTQCVHVQAVPADNSVVPLYAQFFTTHYFSIQRNNTGTATTPFRYFALGF